MNQKPGGEGPTDRVQEGQLPAQSRAESGWGQTKDLWHKQGIVEAQGKAHSQRQLHQGGNLRAEAQRICES